MCEWCAEVPRRRRVSISPQPTLKEVFSAIGASKSKPRLEALNFLAMIRANPQIGKIFLYYKKPVNSEILISEIKWYDG